MASGAAYVSAAVIAASAAYLGLIIGKEGKTTEFRQAWIDAQREDLASALSIAVKAGSTDDPCERKKSQRAFDLAVIRIRLRDNPTKREWAHVIDALSVLQREAFVMPRPDAVARTSDRIVELSQDLLKIEWDRVRAGERVFRWAKYVVPSGVAFCLIALAHGRGFIIFL